MTDRLVEDLLEHQGGPGPDSTLGEVQSWLEDLSVEVRNVGSPRQAVIREAVVKCLRRVEAVGSPAKLADAFLTNPPRTDGELQGTSVAFEDPEPWPELANGPTLLSELSGTFERYLALPNGAATTLALWTLHAHAFDAWQVSPVLAITSPEKRCGKTTLLNLLAALAPRPLSAANVTAAAVFRSVERWRPTLLVDEADTFLNRHDQLRGIFNSGHVKTHARVLRTVGDEYEPRHFGTWAPKALALIGKLPDTLADRSVEIRMRRRAPDETVERLRLDQLEDLEPLRRRAWTWAQEHLEDLRLADPAVPESLHDRARDNWRPLLAIADLAGVSWPQRARTAATVVSRSGRGGDSLGIRLLEDVRKILDDYGSSRIRSKKLVRRLCDLEEAPWSEYKGRGLTPVSLANFLRSFDVSSKQIRFESGSYKGYEASAFDDAFKRYLAAPGGSPPAQEPKHPKQSRGDEESREFATRNVDGSVSESQSAERVDTAYNVSGVSASDGYGQDEEASQPDPKDELLSSAKSYLDLVVLDPQTQLPTLSHDEPATYEQVSRLRRLARDPALGDFRARVLQIVDEAIENGISQAGAWVLLGELGRRIQTRTEDA